MFQKAQQSRMDRAIHYVNWNCMSSMRQIHHSHWNNVR